MASGNLYASTNKHRTESAIRVSPEEGPQPPSDSQRGCDPRKVRHTRGEVTEVGEG